jgi:hypothetical protein
MRGNKFGASQINASADESRLAVAHPCQDDSKASNDESGNRGEVFRFPKPSPSCTKPVHERAPLYWFPWALLATPFAGTLIAWLLIWRGKLWI